MSRRERPPLAPWRWRDDEAFTDVVQEYQNKVFNLVFRMIGSKEEAEDLAQEVFVTVFRHIDQFRGDAKFSTWLYRIAANHCKNRIKYLSRRHTSQNGLDDVPEHHMADGGGA